MKKLLTLLLAATMSVSLLAGCGGAKEETPAPEADKPATSTPAPAPDADVNYDDEVTASGSSAVFPLAEKAAELFMEQYPDAIISVAAGGSGTGLKQVAAKEVTIGNSDLFAEEKLEAADAANLKDHKVCLLTVAPVVNKDLGVDDLSTADLIDIFTGKITNWKEVGGPDLKIMLITRPSSSGTRALFSTYAMGGAEEIMGDLENDNSGELKQAVVDNKGAIGYLALSYIDDSIQSVSIDGVAPTFENVYAGDYTVWGYEHCYTNITAEPNPTADAFLAFMMSDEFAPNIEAMGYGASSKLTEKAIATHEPTTETVAPALDPNANYDEEVTASGSSAVFPLAEKAAELFMDMYPDSIISVAAGGSGTGLKQVSAKEVTIGNSDLFAEEKLEAAAAAELKDHKVCLLTVAPVVNKDLGVSDLTTAQIIDIFTGKITNWSEVGGPDLDIMLITRPSSSGTRALFSTYAMGGAEEIMGDLENDNSGELKQAVVDNKGAIGYLALSYIDESIAAVSIDGVAPTFENVYAGDYTVWGYEHCYTNTTAEANETADAFLAYMMSAEFAPNIEAMGYGASSKLTDAAIATHE